MGKPRNKKPNRAKSIISQPLFRCRQEQPGKGKGSYRREASHWEASSFPPPQKAAYDLRRPPNRPPGMLRSAL